MPSLHRQFGRCWRVFAAMLLLAAPSGVCAQLPQSASAPASILIGGYRIAIGMTIEQVNGSLGGVFSASMADSKTWLYRQGNEAVAAVFLDNGRVIQIVKNFNASLGMESVADGMIKAYKDAVDEFVELTRGLNCSSPYGGQPSSGEGYQVSVRWGQYLLNHWLVKMSASNLAVVSRIYVVR